MHRPAQISRCSILPTTVSIASSSFTIYDFLAPSFKTGPSRASKCYQRRGASFASEKAENVEHQFFNALSRLLKCPSGRRRRIREEATLVAANRAQCIGLRNRSNATRVGQRRSLSYNASQKDTPRISAADHSTSKKTRPKSEAGAWDFFDPKTLDFAKESRLPPAFFHDLNTLHEHVGKNKQEKEHSDQETPQLLLGEQLELLESVRQLEEKLAKARNSLRDSLHRKNDVKDGSKSAGPGQLEPPKVVLSKEDYKHLVDLYFHTYTSRFDPESPHASPTPTFLEDYVFQLSEDFAPPQAWAEFYEDEKGESPLKEIERMVHSRQLHEVSAFKDFVDLLIDDYSSNTALFRAYKRLPQPGVAFLPSGTVRLFLQRMSTPWQKSEKSMIRYLTLIDDMQKANLPITRWEWASAIYLAGRSFSRVTDTEVRAGMALWKQMEQEAGVKAHHVTFNILFDIAVRANKYPLAQTILKEMHDRGLQLNRLGRVSVIYYHGLRGDGDAVRKAYRDFVDAGEIVDTLVLNCVIAALYNAQEPAAAEQIYERMKNLHVNTRREIRSDGTIEYFRQYPGPSSEVIDRQLAANSLGRILLFSRRLKDVLPEHHQALQELMPLRPDHITFRTMISYHANVSGNLNRITVLINEMTELFGLNMHSLYYQLLFKGFALHGATKNPDATWNIKRLNMVWESCRYEIKDGIAARRVGKQAVDVSDPLLPSMRVINGDMIDNTTNGPSTAHFKRLSEWDDFILDLAAFPRERRKHIERVHAELFDEDQPKKESFIPNPFCGHTVTHPRPLQQEHYYPLGDRKLDEQEGEYVLPSPMMAINPANVQAEELFSPDTDSTESQTTEKSNANQGLSSESNSMEENTSSSSESDTEYGGDSENRNIDLESEDARDFPAMNHNSKHQVIATRALICWLLRAYANSTGSRAEVEKIWNGVRKLWHNADPNDQAAVVRVLRRCLKNCDQFGPPL